MGGSKNLLQNCRLTDSVLLPHAWVTSASWQIGSGMKLAKILLDYAVQYKRFFWNAGFQATPPSRSKSHEQKALSRHTRNSHFGLLWVSWNGLFSTTSVLSSNFRGNEIQIDCASVSKNLSCFSNCEHACDCRNIFSFRSSYRLWVYEMMLLPYHQYERPV
jgi:hypothetical protein